MHTPFLPTWTQRSTRLCLIVLAVTIITSCSLNVSAIDNKRVVENNKAEDSKPTAKEVHPMMQLRASDLYASDDLLASLMQGTPYETRPAGLSEEDFTHFFGNKHMLTRVEKLFRNALEVPAYSDRASKGLLEAADKPARLMQNTFKMLDVYASPIAAPKDNDWRVDWIDKKTSAQDALYQALEHFRSEHGLTQEIDRQSWEDLPDELQALVMRVLLASVSIEPLVHNAYNRGVFSSVGTLRAMPSTLEIFKHTNGAFTFNEKGPPNPESFNALDDIDLAYLGFASMTYHAQIEKALSDYLAWVSEHGELQLNFSPITINTPAGRFVLHDSGNSKISTGDLILDIGGDDHYISKDDVGLASPKTLDNPIAQIIDIAGNDRYQSDGEIGIAFGICGIASLIDCAGNDSYEVANAGLGSAYLGSSLLIDYSGDDSYRCEKGSLSQGAAVCGVGMLVDRAGDDRYFCGTLSQGYAGPLGVGILLDVAGGDHYECSATAYISKIYEDRPLSFSQGVAYGRRASSYDGHNLAGGIAALIDGAGNDNYITQTWGQGASYWWGLGFLQDMQGDDRYTAAQYSQGAAAHFGIGSLVDREGNDRYNDLTTHRQVLGHGRDCSIGCFVDGAGDDIYYIPHTSAGCGNVNSVGFFWDRSGNDEYRLLPNTIKKNFDPKDVLVLGFARMNAGYGAGSPRNAIPTLGLFLDTQGKDHYVWTDDNAPLVPDLNESRSTKAEKSFGWSLRADVD